MSPTDRVPPDRVPPDNAPPDGVSADHAPADSVSDHNTANYNAATATVPNASPLLRLMDVHSYYGESHVLQGVTFDVAAAEVVCLLGRNGVGKTTTLRSIIGITPPRRGQIRFAGHEVAAHSPHRIARLGIGFVPEDRRIFPELSVEDNLEVVRRHPGGRWPLERIYETMPLLADIRHRRGDVLSGGQQQMLAIARALAIDPTLLLLDEPNEGLAPIIVEEIGRLVDALAGDTTILFTEHKLHFSMLHAQRALVMEKGRIVWQGTTAELAARTDIQDRYLGL